MDSRSGGKIVTKRYRRHSATPYDRVPPSAQPARKDPNWLARVIIPATRVIASGASKILSSVFDSDSSSSTSLSGDASESDDVVNNEVHDNGDGIYSLIKDHGNNDKSSDVERVEQLLMNGNFSREECDRFIEIIKSRALADDEHLGTENSDKLHSKAVMEARKWLDSKKVESNPMIDMGDEFGSPADVAKHYLKSRSPWLLSPSSEHFEELQTPTTMAAGPFQEGASMAAASHEFSSLFKKRSSLASGSWNIQDEIRSVRAKATEDLLKSSPSMRNSLHARDALINSSISGKEGEEKELNSSKDLDTDSTIAENPTVLAIPTIPVLEKHNPEILDEENAASDLHSNDPKDSKTDDEIGKLEETQVTLSLENVNETIANVMATTEYQSANDDKHDEPIAVNVTVPTEHGTAFLSEADDKHDEPIAANVTVPTEHGAAFLSEASVEVPVMEETDSMANVSMMNSDNKLEADKVDEVPAKQEAKKPVRSSSRRGGRGRGRKIG